MNEEYWNNYPEDDDYADYEDEWEYDDYYEPEEPPTRWQRVKAWFNRLYWKIRYKPQPNTLDDIPF